jgi:hypothetical protein
MVDVGGTSAILVCQLLMKQPASSVKNMTDRGAKPRATLRTSCRRFFTFYKEVTEICKNLVNNFIVADHYDTVMFHRAPTISTKRVPVKSPLILKPRISSLILPVLVHMWTVKQN